MTKKNVLNCIDKIFWLLVALFPLIAYVVLCIHSNEIISLQTLFNSLGLGFNLDSPIYTTLNSIFGVGGGILELVSDTGILLYATYFITIELVHFIIDCLLVIIRWSQNLLHKATKE